jgi:hypothetical protein
VFLDEVAEAERSQGRRAAEYRAESRARGARFPKDPCPDSIALTSARPKDRRVIHGFCKEDSDYFSGTVDPPATKKLRSAAAVYVDYGRLALTLRRAPTADASTALEGFFASIRSDSPAAAEALRPLAALARAHDNAQVLRRIALDVNPQIVRLILSFEQGSEPIFNTLTLDAYARLNTSGLTDAEVHEVEAKRIEVYREAVADYTVLLKRYSELIEDLTSSRDDSLDPVTLGRWKRNAELLGEYSRRLSTSIRNLPRSKKTP